MKKENVGVLGVIFGWAIGCSFLFLVILKIAPIKITASSFLLMYFLPIVYFLLSEAAGLIVKDLFHIEITTKVRWGCINFLMSLLSPLVVVVYVAAIVLPILCLVVVAALSPLFPTSVEFEFLKKDKDKDLEFIRAFDTESWKQLPRQENDLIDDESGDYYVACYDAKGTFGITLCGDITRKAVNGLKGFAEHSGYKAIKIRTFG